MCYTGERLFFGDQILCLEIAIGALGDIFCPGDRLIFVFIFGEVYPN